MGLIIKNIQLHLGLENIITERQTIPQNILRTLILEFMKTLNHVIFRDKTLLTGLGLILFSLGIFLMPDFIHSGKGTDTYFGIFILNYLISIVFFIIAWIREIPKFRISSFHQKIEYGFIHLILCLISAYSLNREIPVFEQSVPWLQVLLVLQSGVLLLSFVKDRLAKWLQFVYWGLMGTSFSLFLYLSIYLIPLYPVGFAAFFVFGLSLHAFVPLYFVLALVFYLMRKDNRKKWNIISFSLGIMVCGIVVSVYLTEWKHLNQIITNASDKSLMDEKNDLPEWTIIAQRMPQNSISEKLLKTDLVYTMAPEKGNWEFFDMPSKNFDEIKKHDPLVMMATFFFGKPNLTTEHKIKILESMYDSRHKAQERLWAGEDLQTSHILTNVRLYPNLRIAYTEKFLTVRNTLPKQTWRKSQEAIYTFHLPEGAVVTSLSLWIHGKEEKAILTSKHKADTAYKTIVGVESHDPSLVRWQEGNTISVRVFPCTPDEDRRFKIGITAPLRKESGKLVYDNIWFDGPAPFLADEGIKIHTMDNIDSIIVPSQFAEENINTWTYEGKYKADWALKFPVIPIHTNVFSFDGKSYQISECQKKYIDFIAKDVYLDVNKEWTRDEFDQVRKLASSKNIYVIQNQRIKVTDQNAAKLFDQLVSLNFSIFPFYEITDPQNSLLISKGSPVSPNISDLGESEFTSKLKSYTTNHGMIKLFNLNQNLSPYLKTLKELRVFEYDYGSMTELSKLITEMKFVKNQENAETVVINDAGIKITETADSAASNAPDHLMRLFSYNNVMFQTGTHYFDKEFFDPAIADKAYKAYVVSPVTSLVVLESAQDYQRFDIKDDGTSLKNASMKSSGAVPEPHEWLIIIVLLGIVGYLYLKKRRTVIS